jgi:hypothetical protein
MVRVLGLVDPIDLNGDIAAYVGIDKHVFRIPLALDALDGPFPLGLRRGDHQRFCGFGLLRDHG